MSRSSATRVGWLEQDPPTKVAAPKSPPLPTSARAPTVPTSASPATKVWPGLAVAGVVAVFAYAIHFLPVAPFRVDGAGGVRHPVSAAILAILLGLLTRGVLGARFAGAAPGCRRIVKGVVPLAIVLMGAGLDFTQVARIGASALGITLLTMTIAIAGAYAIGRSLGLGRPLALLIGAGTGICGNSAIVAVAPVINAKDEDVAVSVGTINLCGLLIMLVCPILGAWLALTSVEYGVWAGTTIHAVPQVVAAGYAHADSVAGQCAMCVKLVRVTLLAPFVVVVALMTARRRRVAVTSTSSHMILRCARIVPWFVWGFVMTALMTTFGLFPELSLGLDAFGLSVLGGISLPTEKVMTGAARIMLTLAMAAIGLELRITGWAGVGGRAGLTGLTATVVLALLSLGLSGLLL